MLLIAVIAIMGVCNASPTAINDPGAVLPIVFWHGMGDTGFNEHIEQWLSEQVYPGTYVKSIKTGATADEDRKSSFFANMNEQVEQVCRELKADQRLLGGFNAIGFSQGGQFLRAYVERCNDPPVKNLLTLGSQHQGVADVPQCQDVSNWRCSLMRSVVKRGVYSAYVQSHIVQGQYYKDPKQYDSYLKMSGFLADINNERAVKNSTYRDNMLALSRLIMIKFEQDTMVVPKESQWFGYYDVNGDHEKLLSMRETESYKQDWIGLKQLDAEGKLKFHSVDGDHLRISLKYLKHEILFRYFNDTAVPTVPDEPYENDFLSSSSSSTSPTRLQLQLN